MRDNESTRMAAAGGVGRVNSTYASLSPLDLHAQSTVDRAAEALRHALFAGHPAAGPPLGAGAAAALRQALFAGDLAAGAPLREVARADSLGVGRSTIREALG